MEFATSLFSYIICALKADWNWNAITGLCSIFVASLALATSIKSNRSARELNRISVMPHITMKTDDNAIQGVVCSTIINNGLGPARIKNMTVTFDGREIDFSSPNKVAEEMHTLIQECFFNCQSGFLEPGHLLASKDQHLFLRVEFESDEDQWETVINRLFQKIKISIDYESLYGVQDNYNNFKSTYRK